MVDITDSNARAEAQVLKILVLGDQSVGKTSLLMRYTKNQFSDIQGATLGVDFKQKEVVRNKSVYLVQIWDSAGQERFRTVTRTFYKKASGIILAYDCTNSGSFDNIKNWVQQICAETSGTVPLVLISTKNDEIEKKIGEKQGKELAKELNLAFFQTSAKENCQVEELFDYLIDKMLGVKGKSEKEVIVLGTTEKVKRKKVCCGNK